MAIVYISNANTVRYVVGRSSCRTAKPIPYRAMALVGPSFRLRPAVAWQSPDYDGQVASA